MNKQGINGNFKVEVKKRGKENMSNHNVRLGYQFINVVKRFSSFLTITVLQESKEITEDVVGLYMTG